LAVPIGGNKPDGQYLAKDSANIDDSCFDGCGPAVGSSDTHTVFVLGKHHIFPAGGVSHYLPRLLTCTTAATARGTDRLSLIMCSIGKDSTAAAKAAAAPRTTAAVAALAGQG
jgi:hypothetical protein